jgi:RNA polymerase sigma factor (sigma-70 family)
LAALSVPEREVIELSYFKAMSQSEIAAQLGLPLTTVRVIAASALVRMGRGLEAARA